ncbi:Replicase polyprotein 1a [Trichinella spiralis]|uniref:Replicase polyprotein 1a n=1 Tax=Trichinella spiralis TaxID=6334 RepID=A0ABR3KCU4_TRISP
MYKKIYDLFLVATILLTETLLLHFISSLKAYLPANLELERRFLYIYAMDRLLNMLDQKALMVETMKEVEEAASSALADKVQWDHNSLLGLSYEEKCNFLKLRELDFLNAVKLQLIKNRKLRFQKLKNEQKLIEEESKSTQPDSTIAISERNSTSSSDAVQLETDTKPQCSTAVEEVCQLINEGEILRKHNRDLQCLKSEITTRLKFKKERADLFELYLEIRKRKNMLNLKKNQEKKANKSKPNAEDVNFEKRQQRLIACADKFDMLQKLNEEVELKLQQKKELSKQYADLLFEVQESKGWRNKGPLVSRMMRCIMGCREDLRNFLRSESKLKGEESELEDDIDPETPWLMKKEKIAMHGEKRDELSSVAFTERNENLNVVSPTELDTTNTRSNSSPNIPKETEDFIDNFFKFYKKHLRLPRDAHLLEELQSIAFQQAKHRILAKKIDGQLQKFFKLYPQFDDNSVNVDGSVGTFEVDEVDKESDWEKQSAEVNEENHLPTETVLSSDKVHVEVVSDVQYEEGNSEEVGEEKVHEEEVYEEEDKDEEEVDEAEDDEIEVDEEYDEEDANFALQLQGDSDFSDNNDRLLIDDSDEKYHELEIASNQFMEMDEAAVENWNVAAADYPEASSAVENVAYVIEQNDNGEEVITLIDDTDEYVIDDSNNTQYDGQQYLYADSLCMLPDTGNAFHGYYVENQLEQPMPDDPMLSAGSDTLPFYESGLNDDMNLDQCYFETNNNAQYALFPNYNTDNSDGYVIDSQWVGAAAEEYFQQQQYPDFGIIEEQSSESEEQDADQI